MAAPSIVLPNPLTPLAWLPPDIAGQLEASRYLYSATTGAWLWDQLMSLHEEYRLFTTGRIRLSDIVYVLARISSLAFILTTLMFQVAPVGNCHVLAKVIGWSGGFAMPLNSLLFFFRVRAVFNSNKFVVSIFALLWLATLGCLSAPFAVDGIHIGTTRYCVNSDVKSFSSAGIVIVAVHDTIVFFAITTKLTMFSLADTWPERIRTFFSGRGMGFMSKALLTTGQLYYLVTVQMNIVAMVLILTPSVPPVLQAMFSIPNVALQNAMACRVFRQLKLGLIRETPTMGGSSHPTGNLSGPIRLIPTSRSNINMSNIDSMNFHKSTRGDVESIIMPDLHSPKETKPMMFPVQVGIKEETEVKVDEDEECISHRSWKPGHFA